MHKWENICADRQIWKINGINSLQFKTNHYKEIKPNVHHIIVDLTPRLIVDDLFHTMFDAPTHENIFYYQEAYKHLSSQEGWDTFDIKEKQKKMEEDIQIMKDQQLYETHVQEEKEKEQNESIHYSIDEDSPAYTESPSKVYTSSNIINLTGNPDKIKEIESEEKVEEELEEENLNDLSLLTNIAPEEEIKQTKTITMN